MARRRRRTDERAHPQGEANVGERDEPAPSPDDVSYIGPEPLVVAGETPAGFPFGVSLGDFRASVEADASAEPCEPGWLTAKHALLAAARAMGGADARCDVGFVKYIGSGLSRDGYFAEVEIAS